jgi:hypothetical protein
MHSRQHRHQVLCRAEDQKGSGDSGDKVEYSKEFGYSRKDVILIGLGILAFGYALYYGLQAGGVSPGLAGNYVQLFVVLGLCIGWIGSYLGRVANKDMTYVKQLEQYEKAVMEKRFEEMPESEKQRLLEEVERAKAEQAERVKQRQSQK